MAINGINHASLRVRNLDVSEHFYTEVLGLKRVGTRGVMRFYSSGRYAHELALVEDPDFRNRYEEGLLHLCFNVGSEEALRGLYRRCRAAGVPVSGGVDHVVMHAFYSLDPDGYVVELGVDRPRQEWEHNSNAFASDRPLQL